MSVTEASRNEDIGVYASSFTTDFADNTQWSANDTKDYGPETVQILREAGKASADSEGALDPSYSNGESRNTVGTEVTYLHGEIDTELVVRRHLQMVLYYRSDGVEVSVPDLGVWEFGATYPEAVENAINYMAADFGFLISCSDSQLTEDARGRRSAYLEYFTESSPK